ncbi:MAG: hypothetical protein ACFFFB_09290 [Candidatus Heimdallarchaeota archaeon]
MIFQTIEFLEILGDIFGAIFTFISPLITPIGEWMVSWVSITTQFLKNILSTDYAFYIIICAVLVVAGIIVNIIWPGDKPSSKFQTTGEKFEDFEDKFEGSEDEGIVDEIKRCKDCGNPVGDSDICPLCGARQI